ncbi:2-amino-4-hydroxy-6-hydroxymethyldihydropteridine diphosphokinase [Agarivorans sp. 1_MG-2023]|uniref:2-amino-4-hydroxy-6- hydroxymethyldihydropteridine diphosphokinase n=1 Tax=Agarivorans sp. 1_MG-2023 TaxID=3062634 RepID=UPI0026E1AE15|nr:2-amino-4-hydroxy-6-hydroxymethyldihydropteridine diphosphokinase [Agarivorans sp. 1_MG-2023]MDO6765582.1 2-amino-4-hydroxy-6-hydroxymethyldihydropteridine diphosphokinase [Agarivorans sp. 1_MG-2023]
MYYLCSLGSNIEPLIHLPKAVQELGERLQIMTFSAFIETTPMELDTPNKFVNALAWFQSEQSPAQLKQFFNQLEARHGRNRNDPLSSSKDRSLDIDLFGPCHNLAALSNTPVDAFLVTLQQQLFASAPNTLPDSLSLTIELTNGLVLPLGERPTTINFN